MIRILMAEPAQPLGRPIRPEPAAPAQPVERWIPTRTDGYVRSTVTGVVCHKDRLPKPTKPAALAEPATVPADHLKRCKAAQAAGLIVEGKQHDGTWFSSPQWRWTGQPEAYRIASNQTPANAAQAALLGVEWHG